MGKKIGMWGKIWGPGGGGGWGIFTKFSISEKGKIKTLVSLSGSKSMYGK